MNVQGKMALSFLTETDSSVTGRISNSNTSAFTSYQRTSNSAQTHAKSSQIFNPTTHVVTTPLQERMMNQRQSAQSITAEKVLNIPLPSVPHSSQVGSYCDNCKMKLMKEWEANPANEELTLKLLLFMYSPTPDWLQAQQICNKALEANPHSVKLLAARGFIKSKLQDYLLLITNNKQSPCRPGLGNI